MSGKKQFVRLSLALVSAGAAQAVAGISNPWADQVVSYVPGSNANASYQDAGTALGAPEQVTGEGFGFPGAVTMFNPAFGTDEIVSIGTGGSLTVRFDEPIQNDAGNLYGVDLIVFGNEGFLDADFPNGQLTDPAGLFATDLMEIEVSADGSTFFPLGQFQEGLFPTQAFLDTAAQQTTPGSQLSNFTKPMNPALGLSDFDGLSYADALNLYDGSGGGTPIDIAGSGLSAISFVRISNTSSNPIEIDALAAVPEPTTGLLLASTCLLALWRKR